MANDLSKSFPKPIPKFVKNWLEVEKNPIESLLADILEELKERRKENEGK